MKKLWMIEKLEYRDQVALELCQSFVVEFRRMEVEFRTLEVEFRRMEVEFRRMEVNSD